AAGVEVMSEAPVATGEVTIAGAVRNIAHVVVGTGVAVPHGYRSSRFERGNGAQLPASHHAALQAVAEVIARQFVRQTSGEAVGVVCIRGTVGPLGVPLSAERVGSALAVFTKQVVHLL